MTLTINDIIFYRTRRCGDKGMATAIGRKPVLLLLALIASALLSSCSAPEASKPTLCQLGQACRAEYSELEDGKAVFRGYIQLGSDVVESAALLELELTADIKEDPSTGEVYLGSPSLAVRPIGCDTLELTQEVVSPGKYSVNCHVGTQPFTAYRQQMPVQCAKALSLSPNISIEAVTPDSEGLRINTVAQLQKAGDGGSVLLEYGILAQYFDCWYAIEFILDGPNQGIFTVY